MAAGTILIAGLTARALAQSARRAGYAPCVVDCFADQDTRQAAQAWRVLPEGLHGGFTAAALVPLLEELAAEAASDPVGLVLGTGFEDTPRLVEHLARRFRLFGCSGESIRRAKDPEHFFGLLTRLGVRFPETRTSPPAEGAGWLAKRVGGAGGMHIVRCKDRPAAAPHRYFQREVEGEPVSVGGVVGARGAILAFTRQWPAPLERRPYRFGGAVGPIDLDSDTEARLIETALEVSRELDLTGFVSFDFVLSRGDALLVEVNPRAGASLDVLDDERGRLFAAHMAACGAGGEVVDIARSWQPPAARAVAYLYDPGAGLTVPPLDWPSWAADRPMPGSTIAPHAPVATILASAASPGAARALANERLGVLRTLLYDPQQKNGKETLT